MGLEPNVRKMGIWDLCRLTPLTFIITRWECTNFSLLSKLLSVGKSFVLKSDSLEALVVCKSLHLALLQIAMGEMPI